MIQEKKRRGPRALYEEAAFSRQTAAWAGLLALAWVFSATETALALCFLLGAAAVAAAAFWSWGELSVRFNGQALCVLGYVLVCAASCYWAVSGALAVYSILRILPGFFAYWAVLWFSGRGQRRGCGAAAGVSAASALISFLSIDAVGTRWFTGPFQHLTGLFTGDFGFMVGLEPGTRINSVTEDPNVYAGVAGLGVLLGLSLALGAKGKGEKRLHLVCLALNALGFVLVFSVGAAGYILPAFLLFLLFTGRDQRPAAVVLMLETLVVTMAGVVAVYAAVFDGTKEFSVVPLAAMVLCSAALCALEELLAPRASALLTAHPKAALGAAGGLLAALAVYAAAAVMVTGPASLVPRETLERAADLTAGEYTLTVQADAAVNVQIVTKNETDLIMHTETALYRGAADGAVFTVPQDSEVVWFRFTAPEGGTLAAASYSGAADGGLKLGYKLLPGFIANRLQGLWANQNAVQRVQFWRDALKLWKQSPVFGCGLGAMEVGLFSVEPFYYETKYAHNHFVQCLADTGVVGLALFVGLLALSAHLFWRGRKAKEVSPLLPGLGAALVFMVLQATMQVDFSSRSFLLMAFTVFGLLNVAGTEIAAPQPVHAPQAARTKKGKPAPEAEDAVPQEKKPAGNPKLSRALRRAYPAFGAMCALVLALQAYGEWSATSGNGDFYARVDRAMVLDPLHKINYLQSYLLYGMQSGETRVQQTLPARAAALAEERMNAEPNYAVEYFFSAGDTEAAVDALVDHLRFNRSRSEAWQYGFDLLLQYFDGTEEYVAQSQRVLDELTAWEAEAMEPVVLTDMNRTYLAMLQDA